MSIVIPVYNEAAYLRACLDSIARQIRKPFEVIVVDNNSTDQSPSIAKEYSFVTLIREKRQGVAYARTAGFNATRGDIIGRIDADTILASTWVATVQDLFAKCEAGAISGSVQYHHAPWAGFFNRVDYNVRRYLAWSLGSQYALQGANLAIRRSVWLEARTLLCERSGQHEDFDLAIHVREAGYSTLFMPSLQASIACRQLAGSWRDFCRYVLLSPGTYAQHAIRRRVVMYPIVGLAIVAYPLLHALYVGFDETTNTFSWTQLFSNVSASRVNPATFIE